MKLWKRWTAAVLAAAMVLLLLAACGPSGPSAPDAPDKPGSSETGKDPTDPGTGEPGKDPTDEKTEAQKKAAVVEALNTVRKDYGNDTALVMDAEVCAMAEKMAQLQLDGLLGKYGSTLKKALVTSTEATLVGVGVVQNTDPKTKDKIPFMVVVMTY